MRSNYLKNTQNIGYLGKRAFANGDPRNDPLGDNFDYNQDPNFKAANNYGQYNEPSAQLKPKANKFESLNMRKPGGVGIVELQDQERKGRFNTVTLQNNLSEGQKRDMGHLGIENNNNPMQNLGQMSYPKYNYDDRFTDIELNKFNELFTYFDRQANGTMDTRDLANAMRSLGALITDAEVKVLIDKYDPDKTGFVALSDFNSCMAEIQDKPDGEKEILKAFSVFDKYDDNGSLKISEMKHIMERIGDPLKDSEMAQFMELIDNGSDFTSMDDILKLFMPQTTKDLYSKTVPRPVNPTYE